MSALVAVNLYLPRVAIKLSTESAFNFLHWMVGKSSEAAHLTLCLEFGEVLVIWETAQAKCRRFLRMSALLAVNLYLPRVAIKLRAASISYIFCSHSSSARPFQYRQLNSDSKSPNVHQI